jgi:hypothetical protein
MPLTPEDWPLPPSTVTRLCSPKDLYRCPFLRTDYGQTWIFWCRALAVPRPQRNGHCGGPAGFEPRHPNVTDTFERT